VLQLAARVWQPFDDRSSGDKHPRRECRWSQRFIYRLPVRRLSYLDPDRFVYPARAQAVCHDESIQCESRPVFTKCRHNPVKCDGHNSFQLNDKYTYRCLFSRSMSTRCPRFLNPSETACCWQHLALSGGGRSFRYDLAANYRWYKGHSHSHTPTRRPRSNLLGSPVIAAMVAITSWWASHRPAGPMGKSNLRVASVDARPTEGRR